MARFDVYASTGKNKDSTPFLVDVQSDHLEGLTTRVVVPLIRAEAFPQSKLPADLVPVFSVMGTRCLLYPAFIAAVPVNRLGAVITSMKGERDRISAALDRLLGGF